MTTDIRDCPVAVIGGGPVGLAAAAHLLQRGLPVRVYEAGATVAASVRDGATCGCSRPGVTTSTVRRAHCSSGRAGRSRRRTPSRPDATCMSLSQAACRRRRRCAPSSRPAPRSTAITRQGLDKVSDRGRETKPFVLSVERRRRAPARSARAPSSTPPAPGPCPTRSAPAACRRRAKPSTPTRSPTAARRARRATARRYAGTHDAGRRRRPLGRQRADRSRRAREAPAAGRHHLGVRGDEPRPGLWRRRRPIGCPRAASSARTCRICRRGADHARDRLLGDGCRARPATHVVLEGETADGCALSVPSTAIVVATGQRPDLDAHRASSGSSSTRWLEMPARAGAADRSRTCTPAAPCARTATRARAPRARLLHRRHKSYGRAPTFLLLTGYEQVRSVVAAIAGDLEAADDVELVLPETGVCTTPVRPRRRRAVAAGAAAARRRQDVDACCVADAEAKAEGRRMRLRRATSHRSTRGREPILTPGSRRR